jgi:hypothetical protein
MKYAKQLRLCAEERRELQVQQKLTLGRGNTPRTRYLRSSRLIPARELPARTTDKEKLVFPIPVGIRDIYKVRDPISLGKIKPPIPTGGLLHLINMGKDVCSKRGLVFRHSGPKRSTSH